MKPPFRKIARYSPSGAARLADDDATIS